MRIARFVGRGMRWPPAGVRVIDLPERNAAGGRRSRVVLAPRPWRLSLPACAGGATVTIKAAHREEHV
jgi:hypothetical protein